MTQVVVVIVTWEVAKYVIKKFADKIFDHL